MRWRAVLYVKDKQKKEIRTMEYPEKGTPFLLRKNLSKIVEIILTKQS